MTLDIEVMQLPGHCKTSRSSRTHSNRISEIRMVFTILWQNIVKKTKGSNKKCNCTNAPQVFFCFFFNQLLYELLFVLSFIPLLCLHVLVGFYFLIFLLFTHCIKNGMMEIYDFQVEAYN